LHPNVTATSADYSASPNQAANDDAGHVLRLDTVAAGIPVEVQGVDGEDAIAERLTASGIWYGAVVERIASAPFGDPILFRVHGYRLALRRSEAERVRVIAGSGAAGSGAAGGGAAGSGAAGSGAGRDGRAGGGAH
tara:strand:- start:4941 stop:5348 length:408 start_codon:yes stop_codon:yes gene_type:complete